MADDLYVESTSKDKAEGNPVQQALDRFKLAAEADAPQRKRELESSKFAACDQWPEDITALRGATTIGAMAVPARPCLTLDQLGQPVQHVVNQAKNARLAVRISPKSDATEEDAEIRQGLYRNIEVESRASIARNWAFKQASIAGRGYYRILKAYANDGDEDLDIVIKRILNQHSVYLDPFHQEPDGSDAEWAFIVEDVPWSRFKREYPDAELSKFSEQDFQSLGDSAASWVNGDGESRTVRVAEYFCAHYEEVKGKKRHGQQVYTRSIKWQKINAVEVLDEQDWEGRYIPIVKVIGEEWNINGTHSYTGIVNKSAMDAQRSYNYMRSAEVEAIGLAPKAPWLVMEGLIEGYEQYWNLANTRNLPYLQFRAKNINGNFAPPPKRNVEEPAIQALTLASRQAKEDVQTITGRYNEAQGKTAGSSQSGEAIRALQSASDQGNSGYLDNLANISMTHEARIILDLMPFVYDRAERIVKILEGDDDKARSIMLNAPFITNPETQQPMAPPPGTDPKAIKRYDLSKGQFSCVVSIGKSYVTRLAEANDMMGNLSKAVPQMVPLYADIWVRSMDIPGGDEIADRFQKMLPPQLQEGENGAPVGDPVAQAQIQQLQMQLQQAMQLADQNMAKMQIAQLQAESAEKIKAAELEAKVAIERMKADLEQFKLSVEVGIERQKIAAKQQEQANDAALAERQQAIDAERDERDRQHDASQRQVELQAADRQAQTSHIHAMEQQAAKPAPVGGR